jgi:ABC-type multidrug transport system fused ATPase/permease subunit
LSKEDAIFSASLADNISLGREKVKFEDIKYAADIFGLLKFHEVFPKGYHTILNPEGKQLPRSIVIKIMLARSLANNPKILILENIISKMKLFDKEAFLNHVFDNENMTVLLDSSEESIAKRCDKIVRMDSGEVVEIGTYEEMKKKDWFPILFHK